MGAWPYALTEIVGRHNWHCSAHTNWSHSARGTSCVIYPGSGRRTKHHNKDERSSQLEFGRAPCIRGAFGCSLQSQFVRQSEKYGPARPEHSFLLTFLEAIRGSSLAVQPSAHSCVDGAKGATDNDDLV